MNRLRLAGVALGVILLAGSCGAGNTFTNPILAGFYPDPSICRVGADYYTVNSSFAYFPGIPVFHSTDLVNWSLVGHVMDRPDQLNLDSLGVSRGIFAPAIRYHEGTFYVTCTLVDRGGNFVVTSHAAGGPWSNPVWLPQVNGIDPSLFFDDDGKAYLLYNSVAPGNKPLYDGHRTIRIREFDPRGLAVTGEERILVNGGTDIARKPVWIEGPHVFRNNGYYFLIAAEGGTGDQHSEVVFRSKNIYGPYDAFPKNPILTQRNLDPRRQHPVTCTGHADIVQSPAGDWWAVFLGCRPYPPYAEGLYNTGRETFLAPVRWEEGWPVITKEQETVQYSCPAPAARLMNRPEPAYSGNYEFRDDFSAPDLTGAWAFLRTPREKWYSLTERPGYCAVSVRPEECSRPVNPSFLGRRQSHAAFAASIALDFTPASEDENAGLLVFQNEHHFYFLGMSLKGSRPVVQLYRSADEHAAAHEMEMLASVDPGGPACAPVLLKVEGRGESYAFYCGREPAAWRLVLENVPAKYLSTKVAGGFVGCMIAMYATSLGSPGGTRAYFDWFEYAGNDEVYR